MMWILAAEVLLQVGIIVGALWWAHVEIAKQPAPGARGHFGGV